MSTEHEIEELQEAAEHGREQSKLAPVSLTMSILAVLVAVAALLSHRSHTEEVLLQNKATDQWGYYQAKNIRRHTMSQVDELLKVLPVKDTGAAEALLRKNEAAIEKSVGEQEEISKEAKATEAEVELFTRRANRYDLGETLLEVGLVICSITLLTKRRHYWLAGIAFGIAGILLTASGTILH
jgi:phage-related tail protein